MPYILSWDLTEPFLSDPDNWMLHCLCKYMFWVDLPKEIDRNYCGFFIQHSSTKVRYVQCITDSRSYGQILAEPWIYAAPVNLEGQKCLERFTAALNSFRFQCRLMKGSKQDIILEPKSVLTSWWGSGWPCHQNIVV